MATALAHEEFHFDVLVHGALPWDYTLLLATRAPVRPRPEGAAGRDDSRATICNEAPSD